MLALRQGGDAPAEALLQRAVTAGQTLDDHAGLPDDLWAQARYQRAYALSQLHRRRLAEQITAATLAAEVAEQTPQQPVAPDALALAIRLAEALHRQLPGRPDVAELYRRVAASLYETDLFRQTPAYDDHLAYYAFTRYQQPGNFTQAIALYDRLPPDHPTYWSAQTQKFTALTQQLASQPAPAAAAQISEQIQASAQAVLPAAQSRFAQPRDDAEAGALAQLIAAARLALAEAHARRGDVASALAELDTLQQQLADRPAALVPSLQRRIMLLVEADRLDEARATARDMMARFPQAAAPVIDQVVDQLSQRIDALGEQDPAAARLAAAASAMGQLLADWAQAQGFDDPQMLPYRLVVLRCLRLANRPAEALAYLRQTGLDRQFSDNVDVLYERAATLAAQRDPASLAAAAEPLNRLLAGLQPPYPDVYWQAWILRLQLSLDLGQDPAAVARRIRQLRQSHPDLGGPRFAPQLDAMEAHATQP